MVNILTSCLALLGLSSALAVESWKGGKPTIGDLWDEYSNIFPNGNRNAASHRWANFILERSAGLEVKIIEQLFRGFCAVSGSPVTPSSYKRYKYSLPKVSGGSLNGFVYHCCSPCVCDTQEFIRVDTKTVQTAAGPRKFNFQVVGNPCSSPLFNSTYNALWQDPFNPSRQSSLAQSAPDVNCHGKSLAASVMSDNGNVIVGMLFDEEPDNFEGMQFTDVANEPQLHQFCAERKAAGYNSGMGVIFAKVANITRPQALTTTFTTTSAPPSPPFLKASVRSPSEKASENSAPVASASSAQPMAVASFSCLWSIIVLYWLFVNQFQ